MRLNQNMSRKIVAVAMAAAAAATLSVGAFAAGDDGVVAGYLPPQEQMVQGDIALHAAEGTAPAVEESYGGYGAPEGDPIQGDLMLIAEGPAETTDAEKVPVVRGTIGDLRAQMQQGAGTLCVKTDKRTTTLNLALMCEGYADNTRFTLRTVGDHAYLTIGLRSRRDLLIGR